MVADWFIKERGLAFGILNTSFGISLLSAPMAQFLVSNFGWRRAYAVIGSFLVVIVPLSTFC
jgi:predicted MFS family arabinose efflux permease